MDVAEIERTMVKILEVHDEYEEARRERARHSDKEPLTRDTYESVSELLDFQKRHDAWDIEKKEKDDTVIRVGHRLKELLNTLYPYIQDKWIRVPGTDKYLCVKSASAYGSSVRDHYAITTKGPGWGF